MSMTPRWSLPLLAPGQAQKEVFHNESLQILDALVAAAVEQPPLAAPPPAPPIGSAYIVGANPVGDWAGYAHHLASFTAGGWRLLPPREGLRAFVRSNGSTSVFRAGAWDIGTITGSKVVIDGQQVVGSQAAAIANPAAGGVVDAEARTAIGQILTAMRQHGLIAG